MCSVHRRSVIAATLIYHNNLQIFFLSFFSPLLQLSSQAEFVYGFWFRNFIVLQLPVCRYRVSVPTSIVLFIFKILPSSVICYFIRQSEPNHSYPESHFCCLQCYPMSSFDIQVSQPYRRRIVRDIVLCNLVCASFPVLYSGDTNHTLTKIVKCLTLHLVSFPTYHTEGFPEEAVEGNTQTQREGSYRRHKNKCIMKKLKLVSLAIIRL